MPLGTDGMADGCGCFGSAGAVDGSGFTSSAFDTRVEVPFG